MISHKDDQEVQLKNPQGEPVRQEEMRGTWTKKTVSQREEMMEEKHKHRRASPKAFTSPCFTPARKYTDVQ